MNQKAYAIVFKKSAVKELNALPQRVQQRIIDAIRLLSLNPFTEILQIKKMKGADSLYRIRIQDYRVVYWVENRIIKITIIKVGYRKDVYE